MGKVYKARHRLMNRVVALKVMRPEALDTPQAVKRFEREIQVAAQVDHPNIVRALDAGHSGETYFYVMEFVNGIDLASLVEAEGPLPVPLACDFARQVALGLQHIHERGLVHRDIKPQNLVAAFSKAKGDLKQGSSFEAVKILDLGLAILRPPEADGKTVLRLTRVGAVMGTPDFMAPEQTSDAHAVDIRADLYSLGCSLFYLLTAQPLFHAGSLAQKLFQHREAPAPDVRQHRPDLPEGLAQTIKRLLAKKPEERYASPAAAAQALSAYCATAVIAVGAPRSDSTPKTRSAVAAGNPPAVLLSPPRARKPAAPERRPRRASEVEQSPGPLRWPWVLAGALMFGVGLVALLVSLLNRGAAEDGKVAGLEIPSKGPTLSQDKTPSPMEDRDKVDAPKKVADPPKKVADPPKKFDEPPKKPEDPGSAGGQFKEADVKKIAVDATAAAHPTGKDPGLLSFSESEKESIVTLKMKARAPSPARRTSCRASR
jgi:serine/threonine protein kinase